MFIQLRRISFLIQGSDNEHDKDSDHSGGNESSSDDEHQWKKQVKEQYKQVNREKKARERLEKIKESQHSSRNKNDTNKSNANQPKFYEIKEGMEFFSANKKKTDEVLRNEKLKKLPMSDRLKYSNADKNRKNDEAMIFRSDSYGNKQMTFTSRKVSWLVSC